MNSFCPKATELIMGGRAGISSPNATCTAELLWDPPNSLGSHFPILQEENKVPPGLGCKTGQVQNR